MSLRLLNRIHRITPAVAISALCFGAGCISSEEDLTTSEDPLNLVPGYTGYLVARDFNGDHHPDVGAINVVDSSFAVRLNTGTGTFHNVVHYQVGIQPTFIATADFDEDLALDVVVINATTSNISILLGEGDGSFQPAQNQSIADPLNGHIAAAPFGVVTGDFNNDGDIDIVTSNVGTNNISSLLGNGDGTFQCPTTYPLMGPSSLGLVPFPLATLDWNGDGNLDLVSGGAKHIVMLQGHGDGSFTAVGTYPTGAAMSCIEMADFNHDGILDLVTTAIGTSNYMVLLGNGTGSFTTHKYTWSGGIAAECFGIGDLNEDGELDLAVVNTATLSGVGNVAVLLGDGTGSFGNPAPYPLALQPWAASIEDFNGDGDMDVAACNGGSSSISLLFGEGDGTLQQPRIDYPM